MENASKALLISAGALLAVMVLSLFTYVFFTMSQSTSRIYKEMEETKITEINQKFLNYQEKTNLTMQDVITIVNLAKDVNSSEGKNLSYNITVNVNGVEGINSTEDLVSKSDDELSEILADNFDLNNFNCEVNYGDRSKLVNNITIIHTT